MKSKAKIMVEFQRVSSQSKKLGQCADDMKRLRKELDAIVDDLCAGWAGESANLYFQKCWELSEKMKRSERDLDKISDVIYRSAKVYRDAELAAIQLAQD